MPEIVGNAGILVDLDGDCVQEFAEKVLKILDEKTRIDKKTLERSRMFTWEKTARDTLKGVWSENIIGLWYRADIENDKKSYYKNLN